MLFLVMGICDDDDDGMGCDGQATLVQVLIDEYYGFSFS